MNYHAPMRIIPRDLVDAYAPAGFYPRCPTKARPPDIEQRIAELSARVTFFLGEQRQRQSTGNCKPVLLVRLKDRKRFPFASMRDACAFAKVNQCTVYSTLANHGNRAAGYKWTIGKTE